MLDLGAIAAQARESKAAAIVTTEKDFVKWQDIIFKHDTPIYRPELRTVFPHGEETLVDLLLNAVSNNND